LCSPLFRASCSHSLFWALCSSLCGVQTSIYKQNATQINAIKEKYKQVFIISHEEPLSRSS
jgi:hypothetical protein